MLPRMKYTHEIVGTHGGALLPDRAPGACSGSKIPRMNWPLRTWQWPTESSLRGTPQINIRFWQCQSLARGSRRAVNSRTKKILTDDQAELIVARVSFNLISDFVQPKLEILFL